MEEMDLVGRIRRLECLLSHAEKDENHGMVLYYQVIIEDLGVLKHEQAREVGLFEGHPDNKLFSCGNRGVG